jgi:hypothetical protein
LTAILLLKLCLVPALIYAVSLIGRRWGAGVAGWISALPIVAGPILLAIALERGAGFAAISAANTLLAVIACVAFCLAYAWTSARAGIVASLAVALAAFALAGALLQLAAIPPWLGYPVVLVLLALAPAAFPRLPAPALGQARPMPDLPFRMLAGALLTLSVTLAAGDLGPHVSGLLAMFPVMGTILTGFTHRASGRAAAVALLRGMVLGYFAFASFCVVLAYGLRAWPIGLAFTCAAVCALAVQLSMKRFGQAALTPARARV